MRRGRTEITPEREAEVEEILERARDFSRAREDIVAVGLLGSWAKGGAGMESDVDLIALTTEKSLYLSDEAWVSRLGGMRITRTRDWGPLYTERRFVTGSGLEVEFGVAPPEWAAEISPDPNVREDIGSGGLKPVYDPADILGRLVLACRRTSGTNNT